RPHGSTAPSKMCSRSSCSESQWGCAGSMVKSVGRKTAVGGRQNELKIKKLNKKRQSLQPLELPVRRSAREPRRMNYSLSNSRRLLAVTLGLASTVPLSAETLVQYDFTSLRSAVTFSSPTVSATSLSAGAGLQALSNNQQIQLSSASGAAKHIYLQGNQVDEAISA